MSKSRYRLKVAAGTHPGQLRVINQDNVLAFVRPAEMGNARALLVVADGMGGHQAGEIASLLAVDAIHQSLSWMLDQDDSESTEPVLSLNSVHGNARAAEHLETRLRLAVEEANKVIYAYALDNPTDAGNLGCTATCAMVIGNLAVIANVGDSRTYRLSAGGLTQITTDHSYVGQLVREGHLDYEEIFDHPQRNVITRALGSQAEVVVDTWTCALEPGDRLLLCSDGLWEMIRDPGEIAVSLQIDKLDMVVQELIDAANAYGGVDNIAVVVAELQMVR